MSTVVITGAEQGLGLELARLYGQEGHRVVAGCLDPARPDIVRLAGECPGVTVHRLDVTRDGSVAAFADAVRSGPVDILVNNAGIHLRKWSPPDTVSFDDWEATLRVNTLGPARVSFALQRSLASAGGAKLVTISSDWGSVSNHPGTAYDYCSSKAAVNSVMRGIARNWAASGITVLLIHPGWMRTAMGGADAPNLPADSARRVKAVIDGASAADNGRYMDTEGNDMPW
ncbi:SDR family NAD(P)-dependent oxidoreductase [Shinella pollutisoli]|uniref:SDR family NAD(P)-dependent oxidoreductase n=1 Tax=Shinella pollutisoli TaxID=2250594 RepID=A0ABV7DNR3_9HYPH